VGGGPSGIIDRVMLYADAAQKVVMHIPRRLPRPVNLLLMVDGRRKMMVGRKTTEWLHEVAGDPKLGRTKWEYRQEIYGEQEGDGAAGVQATMLVELSDLDVTISDPRSTGMPLTFLDGLSDVELSIAQQISSPPNVVTRWEVMGRQTGTLLGRPASGLDVTVTGVTILTFAESTNEDGKPAYTATEEWTCWDLPAVLQQIGGAA
jgi:hypothetical protein